MSPFLLDIFEEVETGAIKEKIYEWLDEKLRREPEYFPVDVKVQGRKLTVFLDGDNGITIEKCAEFSRYLEKFLDGEKPVGENYVLEVSSPGMDNPFKVLRQYQRHTGKQVSVVKLDGQRIDGLLKSAGEEAIVVETSVKEKGKPAETKEHEISLTNIKSTKLNF